jgi:uncharacterized SAM-binding protein YcdF (DUF218 family)
MRRWDPALPLRAMTRIAPAARAVWEGTRLPPGDGKADAIVVLGATVLPGGVASPSLRARAEGAAAAFREGRAPLVVCTGAHHLRPPGEAVVAREILLSLGVPADAVRIEEISRNTKGNLRCARGVMPPGARRIYVVTEPFHMGRALAIARAEGFEPLPWPVASPAWTRPTSRARWLLRDVGSMAFLLAGA